MNVAAQKGRTRPETPETNVMSTSTSTTVPRHLGRNVVLLAVTAAILAGIFFGGSWLWQQRFGVSQSSAADCDRAQALIDQAQHIPAGKARRDAAYKAYRAEWNKIDDGYLQANVSNYVLIAYSVAAGEPSEQSPESFKKMVDAANGHCDRTIVMPPHPAPAKS